MKSPAFQFYPGDYLGSQRVQLMTLEQEGAYIRLLCYCWQHGSIPADAEQLARLIGKGASTTLATVVQAMFQPDPTNGSALVHERLEFERAKQTAWREKSIEGGKKSAAMRSRKARKCKSRVVQPPLPNGSSQKATLQSSVSVLQSSSSEPNLAKPPAPRARNELLDALASLETRNLSEVTNWGKHAAALKKIRTVAPEVDVTEINRRAANWHHHFDATLTSTALANHWGKCESGNSTSGEKPRVYENMRPQPQLPLGTL